MTADSNKTEWKRELDELRSELRGLREEIKLKIHLAGMDAKDTWNRLEPKFQEIEERAEKAADSAGDELKGAAEDLRQRFKRLRESL